MQSYYTLPETIQDDIKNLQEWVNRYNLLQVTPEKFKGFRVPLGIYEQRQNEIFMMRVRIPGGAITPGQMRGLARIAREKHAQLHITTRQDIQLQNVKLDDIVPMYQALYEIGCTCKGGGGNTVRNITACPDAVVCPPEPFSILPYVVALTEYFLPKPGAYNLPRKFKIAFSGCGDDCGLATMNDVGFIAKMQDGKAGFSVYAGGGMGTNPRVGVKLHDFIPASEAGTSAEAVRRLFDRFGDRKHRQRARLRFVVEKLGEDAFRELYEKEFKAVCGEGGVPLSVDTALKEREEKGKLQVPEEEPADKQYGEWCRFFVHPQSQKGYFMVHIPVPLGDVEPEIFEHLAAICENLGGSIRAMQTQDFLIRWVRKEELPYVYNRLREIKLADTKENLGALVCCKGAATCKLGLCLSQGLCRAVSKELEDAGIYLSHHPEVRVRVSGCPNSCGQHQIGSIGLHGASRRVDGRSVPFYTVLVGGVVGEGETHLAQSVGQVPAKNVPYLLRDFLKEYIVQKKNGGDFTEFVETEGRSHILRLIERHKFVPAHAQDPDFYKDWFSAEEFSLAGRSAGECGAGVFDMIQSDFHDARASYEMYLRTQDTDHLLRGISSLASSLLVVKGADPQSDAGAFDAFEKYFVEEGWVSGRYKELLDAARDYLRSKEPRKLARYSMMVPALFDRLEELYEALDANLQFQTEKEGYPRA